jgi:tRNA(fMet)-specific endonuclease VapC
MTSFTLDTNIIIYLLRGNEALSLKICNEIQAGNKILLNPVSYYEILRGLFITGNTSKLESFIKFCDFFDTLSITKNTFFIAAQIYASLKMNKSSIEDADILIAALCKENNLVLVTNNEKHFNQIDGLPIINWTENN